ncbi:MAG: YcaO-like family protein [Bdellovibrionales bacterium]
MANSSNLAQWLLGQKDRINFKVTQYTWVEDFAPGNSDFKVTFSTDIVGWAIDRNVETALTKAIAEGIERATCIHNGFTNSTGIAAHPDRQAAFSNARMELIERVAFDHHFSNRIPFKMIEPQTDEARFAQKTLERFGIRILFFELFSPPDCKVISAAAFGQGFERPFGAIFGFGCGACAVQAEKAALFESLRNVASHIRNADTESLSISEFERLERPKFMDRFRLALNLEYVREISFLFDSSRMGWENGFPEITISHEELSKPPTFSEAPIRVVRAHSDYLSGAASAGLPSFMG